MRKLVLRIKNNFGSIVQIGMIFFFASFLAFGFQNCSEAKFSSIEKSKADDTDNSFEIGDETDDQDLIGDNNDPELGDGNNDSDDSSNDDGSSDDSSNDDGSSDDSSNDDGSSDDSSNDDGSSDDSSNDDGSSDDSSNDDGSSDDGSNNDGSIEDDPEFEDPDNGDSSSDDGTGEDEEQDDSSSEDSEADSSDNDQVSDSDQASKNCQDVVVKDVILNVKASVLQTPKGDEVEVEADLGALSLNSLSDGLLIKALDDQSASLLRLILDEEGNYVVGDDDNLYELKTPSSQQSGYKLQFKRGRVNIEGEREYEIRADFDPQKQIVQNPVKCILKPVWRGVEIN